MESEPVTPPVPEVAPADESVKLARCVHDRTGHVSWWEGDGPYFTTPTGIYRARPLASDDAAK